MALRDGEIDDDEKRVLGNIFGRVEEHEVTPQVWARMNEVKKKYDF